jgi:cyclic pyranopterin phosphate synthase
MKKSRAGLTHLGDAGEARMVDVSAKKPSARVAVAEGCVVMARETLALCLAGQAKKGDVFGVARIAGIMAAKRTSELIPLCHPLALTSVQVDIAPDDSLPGLRVKSRAKVVGETGVEMEALTAVAVAGLTVIDMVKAVDKGARIDAVQVESKTGGKSGDWHRESVGGEVR